MSTPVEITLAKKQERMRIVGMVLAEYGRQKLAGNLDAAQVLDALATAIEHDHNQDAEQ